MNKYEIIHGEFICKECHEPAGSARFYPATLDITWKCKFCEYVSNVSIYKKRGY